MPVNISLGILHHDSQVFLSPYIRLLDIGDILPFDKAVARAPRMVIDVLLRYDHAGEYAGNTYGHDIAVDPGYHHDDHSNGHDNERGGQMRRFERAGVKDHKQAKK